MLRGSIAVAALTAVLVGQGVAQEQPGEERITELIEHLQDEKLRSKAVDELVRIGKPVVPELFKALRKEGNDPRRKHVLLALGRMESHAAEHLPELIKIGPKLTSDDLHHLLQAIGDIAPFILSHSRGEMNPDH